MRYKLLLMSYVNSCTIKNYKAKSVWEKMCGTDKFGFVVTGTYNEVNIKLLPMVCVCVCVGVGVIFQERGCR